MVSTNSTSPTENQTTGIFTQRNLLRYRKEMHMSHTFTQLVDQRVHTVERLHKRTYNYLNMQFI